MREGTAKLDDFLGRFAEVVELPLTPTILSTSVDLMARHRLRSFDAAHTATALLAGVHEFATIDDDFRRVPHLRLRLLRDAPPEVASEQ
jgi:predicted nucleic acid-binding protein